MDLTKELLAGASFRAKGKWYAAQQVDAFLEELSVRLEEDSREREELAEDARALRRENARLREELAAALARQLLEEKERSDLTGADIRERQLQGTVRDGQYVLTARYACVEDIGFEEAILTESK